MNKDIFLQLLSQITDRETGENLCKAYPEYVPELDSPYWLKLFRDRFPQQKIVDLKEIYLNQVDPLYPCIQQLGSVPRTLVIYLHSLKDSPESLQILYRINPTIEQTYAFAIKNDMNPYLLICRADHSHGQFGITCYVDRFRPCSTDYVDEKTLREFMRKIPSHSFTWY